jgi:hypothetical protein
MLFATSSASGLEFDMMFQTKCIMEEITSNVLVVGEYSGHSKISPGVLVPMVVKVTSSGLESAIIHNARRCCRQADQTGVTHESLLMYVRQRQAEIMFDALTICQVEDPTGKTVYEKATVTSGQFAFTSHENGDYKACFTAAGATANQLALVFKFVQFAD